MTLGKKSFWRASMGRGGQGGVGYKTNHAEAKFNPPQNKIWSKKKTMHKRLKAVPTKEETESV